MHRFLSATLIAVLLILICSPASMALTLKAKTSSSARVYQHASTSSRSASVKNGVGVSISAISGSWARVSKNGITAYMKLSNLKPNESSNLKNAVTLAILQYGKGYGYSAPSSFNCSSLINYCYGRYGYSMKSSASAISTDSRYRKISRGSNLSYGDILCFDTNGSGSCDHVGIYIGSNNFLDASQSAGKVKVHNLSSWYRDRLLWARRV